MLFLLSLAFLVAAIVTAFVGYAFGYVEGFRAATNLPTADIWQHGFDLGKEYAASNKSSEGGQ